MLKIKRLALAVAVAIIMIAAALFLISKPMLVLYDADSSKVYAKWDIYDTMIFSVEFIHSVNQSPVEDFFEIKDNDIYITATKYSAFGAGVQTEIGPGQSLSYDDEGNMIVSGFNMKFDKVNYVVGTVYDHILKIEGEQINLTQLCGRNAHVVFEIRRGF